MSYNYEINYNLENKKNKRMNCICTNNELDSQTYIFELVLRDIFNNTSVIRRIKKSNQGALLSSDDNIIYSNIEKYKLTVLNINYPDEHIVIKGVINQNITSTIYSSDDIYLKFNKNNENFMDIHYLIN